MRKLVSFEDMGAAHALEERLSEADIPALVRQGENPDGAGRTVWIVAEQDLPKAQRVLARFLALNASARRAARSVSLGRDSGRASGVPLQQRVWAHFVQSPVTWILLALSVFVTFYTDMGANRERLALFTISGAPPSAAAISGGLWTPWDDLRAGQLWRLFTPILLHFHPFHILFNAFWMRDLGVPSERFQGSIQYIVFMLWSALLSNLAQLWFGLSPNFGGLSGVVYALLGFLWARGRFDRNSGITVPNGWVLFMVGWMLIGFTGLVDGLMGGSIANYCHLGGFAAGVIYGYIGAVLATRAAQAHAAQRH